MLTVYDKDGALGTIELAGDRLVASTGPLQQVADVVTKALGDAAQAYAEIRDYSTGYTWARET